MLDYLVKHLRTDIVNTIQKLSKVNNGANDTAILKMHNLIKYMLNTKNFGMKLEPLGNGKESLKIMCFSDGNYADNPISRRSMSEFIFYVLVVPVSW